jgi:hypothetical protein
MLLVINGLASSLEKLPQKPRPSPTFSKLADSLNDLLEIQETAYQMSFHVQKINTKLRTVVVRLSKTHRPLIYPLNKLLPLLGTYLDEMLKFLKLMKPSMELKRILINANKLKSISA